MVMQEQHRIRQRRNGLREHLHEYVKWLQCVVMAADVKSLFDFFGFGADEPFVIGNCLRVPTGKFFETC